ncbi:hypothetical protein DITRI_Ditri09bG0145900 [Diplodiscus trichospermus]
MEENENKSSRTMTSHTGVPDVVVGCVMPYIQDPKDCAAVSLVCRRCYELMVSTRKHIKIPLCYTGSRDRLRRRFQHIESLKLKGKPRSAMFKISPKDWGEEVEPWVNEIAEDFNCLKSVHFRRLIVRDSDIEVLARSKGKVLQVLKLDECSGFSTDGLMHVGRLCRQLRTLSLEDSSIVEKDGQWLHEIAINNSVLETLNFYLAGLDQVSFEDLELIARKCRNLASVKISGCEILNLVGFFRAAAVLEEFCGGSCTKRPGRHADVIFPPRLCSLGLTDMGQNQMPIVFPFASLLKKLDLFYTALDTEDLCLLIQRCSNLEVLETMNIIGDRGLEVLARSCTRLKRLRIEHDQERGMEAEEGLVSHKGLMALAQGCLELEYLAVYVSDITNASLKSIGTYLKNLRVFRLVLLDGQESTTDLPLDNGVRALLRDCEKLRRFALRLRLGGLTDEGLGYISRYSSNVESMLLCYVGDSDAGLLELSRGCPRLQKLKMWGCCFSERALAFSLMQFTSLRYFSLRGYYTSSGPDPFEMARPFWNIKLGHCKTSVRGPNLRILSDFYGVKKV